MSALGSVGSPPSCDSTPSGAVISASLGSGWGWGEGGGLGGTRLGPGVTRIAQSQPLTQVLRVPPELWLGGLGGEVGCLFVPGVCPMGLDSVPLCPGPEFPTSTPLGLAGGSSCLLAAESPWGLVLPWLDFSPHSWLAIPLGLCCVSVGAV